MRRKFIAGNWKMFKNKKTALEFANEIKEASKEIDFSNLELAICAPYLQLETLKNALKDTNIKVGAENVYFEDEGAFTGEISVPMLEEIGVDYCIIGHSERRKYFNDTDNVVNKKFLRLLDSKIKPIICVGETLGEREANKHFDIVRAQLENGFSNVMAEELEKVTIAYEPVWAIGTGKTATKEEAEEMCGFARKVLSELYNKERADIVLIQYGGSVKPENAKDILGKENIDGALVGGASLKVDSFIKIAE